MRSRPSPRSVSASARCATSASWLSVSGSSLSTRVRERSGAITSNEGFSVVAPMKVIRAVLDVRENRVLLGFVEAVDLVEEENRAAVVGAANLAGFFDGRCGGRRRRRSRRIER